jgi:hypothetical protein
MAHTFKVVTARFCLVSLAVACILAAMIVLADSTPLSILTSAPRQPWRPQ